MCIETDTAMQQQFEYKQSVSIREAIISDDESTETLIYMVQSAKNVLLTNYNYHTFRKMVAEIVIFLDEDDVAPSFFCGMDEMNQEDLERRSKMVNEFIDQLLRFLAMKVLLEGSSPGPNDSRRKKNQEGITKDKYGKPLFQLNPSRPIRECWKALLMLPLTYVDVCKAFGSDVIDYEEETAGFRGEESKVEWGRQCYLWTIKTYTNLYVMPPSKVFWPKLELLEPEDEGLLSKLGASMKKKKAKRRYY